MSGETSLDNFQHYDSASNDINTHASNCYVKKTSIGYPRQRVQVTTARTSRENSTRLSRNILIQNKDRIISPGEPEKSSIFEQVKQNIISMGRLGPNNIESAKSPQTIHQQQRFTSRVKSSGVSLKRARLFSGSCDVTTQNFNKTHNFKKPSTGEPLAELPGRGSLGRLQDFSRIDQRNKMGHGLLGSNRNRYEFHKFQGSKSPKADNNKFARLGSSRGQTFCGNFSVDPSITGKGSRSVTSRNFKVKAQGGFVGGSRDNPKDTEQANPGFFERRKTNYPKSKNEVLVRQDSNAGANSERAEDPLESWRENLDMDDNVMKICRMKKFNVNQLKSAVKETNLRTD
jgi:hypothetical protein